MRVSVRVRVGAPKGAAARFPSVWGSLPLARGRSASPKLAFSSVGERRRERSRRASEVRIFQGQPTSEHQRRVNPSGMGLAWKASGLFCPERCDSNSPPSANRFTAAHVPRQANWTPNPVGPVRFGKRSPISGHRPLGLNPRRWRALGAPGRPLAARRKSHCPLAQLARAHA